jgi:hypothetical protein
MKTSTFVVILVVVAIVVLIVMPQVLTWLTN